MASSLSDRVQHDLNPREEKVSSQGHMHLTSGLLFAYRRLIFRHQHHHTHLGSWHLRYFFDEFVFDSERRELHRGADTVSVPPRVFDLLDYLIRNRERVLSKDEIIRTVWGGRVISDAALTTRLNAARNAIGDSGDEQRLIKTLPRKGYRFVGRVREAQDDADRNIADRAMESPQALGLPDRPSIAVLPFVNLSADPEQEYFADGVVDDIITALSRFKALVVIARNSSFTFKGRAVDVKQVGRELGVRYVLEGSIRKAANRIRITGQLLDTVTGGHLWANRIEGRLGDIFGLQDQVTESVVAAIAPAVEKAEIERAKRKPTESLDSYAVYLHGMAKLYQFDSRRSNEEALRLFYRAIELDPDFACAYARAATCFARLKADGWIVVTPIDIAEVVRLARKAIELGRDDAIALAASGWALAYVAHDLDAAADLMERALALNSNLAEAWRFGGWVANWLGEPELAVERFRCAMRLDPLDPRMGGLRSGIAHAHFFAGRYEAAAGWAAMALQDNPNFQPALRIAAASNAMAGDILQARHFLARLQELSPTLALSNLNDGLGPYRKSEDIARYEEGLRQAGLPACK